MHDGYLWQGRQYHGWFGNGTKPGGIAQAANKPNSEVEAPPGPVPIQIDRRSSSVRSDAHRRDGGGVLLRAISSPLLLRRIVDAEWIRHVTGAAAPSRSTSDNRRKLHGISFASGNFRPEIIEPGVSAHSMHDTNSLHPVLVASGPYTPGGTVEVPVAGVDPLDPNKLNGPIPPTEQQLIAETLTTIKMGTPSDIKRLNPHPYLNLPSRNSGATLPPSGAGYTVYDVGRGVTGRGKSRLIIDNATDHIYYTNNHYDSFYYVRIQ